MKGPMSPLVSIRIRLLLAALTVLAVGGFSPAPALAVTTSSTFGTTSLGARVDGGFNANVKRVNRYMLGTGGSVSKLSVYLQPTSVTGREVLEGVIYSDSNGAPARLVAVSNALTFTNTRTAGWYSLPFATPVSLQPGAHWIGIFSGGTNRVAGFRWNSVAGSRDLNANSYSSGPSSPFGSFSSDNEQMSLYATYTAG
jgi:hypothetical protein